MVYVINTCVVTNTRRRKSRQMINRAVRRNPPLSWFGNWLLSTDGGRRSEDNSGVDLIIGNQDRWISYGW